MYAMCDKPRHIFLAADYIYMYPTSMTPIVTYEIRRGERLFKIANSHSEAVNLIQRWKNIDPTKAYQLIESTVGFRRESRVLSTY